MVDHGDAWTNNFACLPIDVLYIFNKCLFSGEAEPCVGKEKEEGRKLTEVPRRPWPAALAIQRPFVGL